MFRPPSKFHAITINYSPLDFTNSSLTSIISGMAMLGLEDELIQRLQMAEACLDDAEGTARHLALDLMGFGEIRQKLRGIKAEMALRILESQRQSE